MASPAQIAANRANAQKSTGPRSVEGKSASRFNALKHGIDAASIVIPGEDPADYDALAADYHRDFRPESPSETFHVDTMLRADWQKRRLQRVEADLHCTLLAETPGTAPTPNSPAPAARPKPTRTTPSIATSTAWALPLARNWLRSPNPQTPNPPPIPPPFQPVTGRRRTKKPAVLCTSSAESLR